MSWLGLFLLVWFVIFQIHTGTNRWTVATINAVIVTLACWLLAQGRW